MEMSYIVSPKEKIMNAILLKGSIAESGINKNAANLITDCL